MVQSVDPNEIFGAAGYGPQGFIAPDTLIPYRINFENLGAGSVPTPALPATAAAQRVEISNQLDTDLDWSSLRFTEVGFGDNLVTVPEGRQYYFTTVQVTINDETFNVQIELSFNFSTGKVRAVFQSIDPVTDLPPDVLIGFLPPEDGKGAGKGHLSYTILPKADLPTGTEIRNVALISFDNQTIIATNQIDPQDATKGTDPAREALNTIDVGVPDSHVITLPTVSTTQTFTVSWTGTDDTGGSGIASYDVFVSDDGQDFTPFLTETSDTSAQFLGENGHTYAFYSVAHDHVGNVQTTPDMAQTMTVVHENLSPDIFSQSFSIDENSPNGTVLGTVDATDADAGQTLTYTISGGNTGNAFAIDATSGGLTVKNIAALNYEAIQQFNLTVTVTDNGTPTKSRSATITIDVINVNEGPTIGGVVANQPVNDTALISPLAGLTVADPDTQNMFARVTILNGMIRGDFTAGTTAGWTRTVVGNDIKYERFYSPQSNIGSVVQTAIRAFVFQPRRNAIAPGTTETTSITVMVNDGVAAAVTNSTTLVVTTQGNRMSAA